MAEEKRFILFEYLMFFWKKKWFLISFPILLSVVVAVVSMLVPRSYEGKVAFYIAALNKEEFKDPNIFLSKDYIPDDIPNLSGNVIGPKRVQFTIKGNNKEEVESSIERIADIFYTKLIDEYTTRKKQTENDLEFFNRRLKQQEQRKENISNKINFDEIETAIDLINALNTDSNSEELIQEYGLKVNRMKNDLAAFEEPGEYFRTVKKEDNQLLSNSVLAFIVGIFLSILILMLWKYMVYAKGQLEKQAKLSSKIN